IGELIYLESLNIAGNQLTELPFEIVELIRFYNLQQVIADPNPWKSPTNVKQRWLGLAHNHDLAPLWPKMVNPVCSSYPQPTSAVHQLNGRPNVPSLTEMVLRQLSTLDPLNNLDIRSLMPPQSPESVICLLGILSQQTGRRCTCCKRPIVLAGEEWIEWWSV